MSPRQELSPDALRRVVAATRRVETLPRADIAQGESQYRDQPATPFVLAACISTAATNGLYPAVMVQQQGTPINPPPVSAIPPPGYVAQGSNPVSLPSNIQVVGGGTQDCWLQFNSSITPTVGVVYSCQLSGRTQLLSTTPLPIFFSTDSTGGGGGGTSGFWGKLTAGPNGSLPLYSFTQVVDDGTGYGWVVPTSPITGAYTAHEANGNLAINVAANPIVWITPSDVISGTQYYEFTQATLTVQDPAPTLQITPVLTLIVGNGLSLSNVLGGAARIDASGTARQSFSATLVATVLLSNSTPQTVFNFTLIGGLNYYLSAQLVLQFTESFANDTVLSPWSYVTFTLTNNTGLTGLNFVYSPAQAYSNCIAVTSAGGPTRAYGGVFTLPLIAYVGAGGVGNTTITLTATLTQVQGAMTASILSGTPGSSIIGWQV